MPLPIHARLFTHMEWADALLWRAVLAEKVVSWDDYVREGTFHLHSVQRAYLCIWTGEPSDPTDVDDFARPVEIRDWARSYYSEASRFLDSCTEDHLAEIIPLPWTRFIEQELGEPCAPATLGDMLIQVTSHSVHHRAQINRRIREVGGSPAFIDYIAWVWRGCPNPDWDG